MSHPKRTDTAADRIYNHLFDRIVHTGELRPGTLLSESDLAKQLETSRTPIRETLLRLEAGGLVKRYPGRGYLVTEITVQDVDEIFELRLQLELCALHKSYRMIEPELLDELEQRLLSLDQTSSPDCYYAADRALHRCLVQCCGNSRLCAFLQILDSQIERVRYISAQRPDRLQESRAEHLGIVRAIRDRNLPKAEELLAAHIRNVGESTKAVCEQSKQVHSFSHLPHIELIANSEREEPL